MNWGVTGILIIFGAFIVLLIVNPNLSCFGKRIKSPFYPLVRKKNPRAKTVDYDFHLVEGEDQKTGESEKKGVPKTDDDGFHLD